MSRLRPAVNVVQFVAGASALAFVVLLFVNEPGGWGDAGDPNVSGGGPDGATIFADNCARCHGGEGGGGIGPQLSDGEVVADFPDIEDQIAVVTNGGGGMPAFGGNLSEDEIRAVVEYTRTL